MTRAHLAQLGGTGVFVSALRDKLHRRRDRLRRPLAEGPADQARPADRDRRDPAARRPPGRAGRPDEVRRPAAGRAGRHRLAAPGRASCAALRPDLEYVPIRGNVDTRIGKVTAGELDAVVLAAAGLDRIGREAEIAQIFEVDEVLPAPGQGALAVECAADRADLIELLSVLDDPATRAAVTAERAVLAALEAGCAAPVGAFALPIGRSRNTLNLTAAVVADRRHAVGAQVHRRTRLGAHGARPRPRGRHDRGGAGTLMGEQSH